PRMILEIADCQDRIELEFDIDSEAARANSLHKLDTLITALRVFREGMVAEYEPYDERERELAEQREGSWTTGRRRESCRRPGLRAWRNRQTHRSQKPDSGGSTPSARTCL